MNLFWTDDVHTRINNTRSRDVARKAVADNEIIDWPTFCWRHAMEMAVEHYNKTRLFITFLWRLFEKIYIQTSQIKNKNDVKSKRKYKRWIPFHFSDIHWSVNAIFGRRVNFARHPLRSHFGERQETTEKNEIDVLNDTTWFFSWNLIKI